MKVVLFTIDNVAWLEISATRKNLIGRFVNAICTTITLWYKWQTISAVVCLTFPATYLLPKAVSLPFFTWDPNLVNQHFFFYRFRNVFNLFGHLWVHFDISRWILFLECYLLPRRSPGVLIISPRPRVVGNFFFPVYLGFLCLPSFK